MAIACVAALQTVPAAAQQLQPPLPTREEITPPPVTPTAPSSRLEVSGDIERSACPLADPSYAAIRVTITEAVFNGLGPVSPATLEPAYAKYLNTDQPIAVICEIRDAVATGLRRLGYLAAVQVPVQKIEGGRVTFEVLYGKLVAVRVRGDVGRAEPLIAGYLSRLTREPVFNRNVAERYLLLARDVPGYDIRLALRPAGGAAGELIGDVTVTRRRIEADLNVQNYAAPDSGRWGGQLRVQLYGLTGLGDRTTVSIYSTAQTREQQILQLAHDFRVGSDGLGFAGRLTYAWTRPSGVAGGQITARTLFSTLEANYPLVRTERATLRAALGLDYVNQVVRFDESALTRDRLRVAYLRLEGEAEDVERRPVPKWRLGYSAELRQGLDILDASSRVPAGTAGAVGPSRFDGDPTGTLIRASGFAEAPIGRALSVSLAPRAQYAFGPLLSFEEFSGGTYTVGRGYDPGTIIGDDGIGFAAELRLARFAPFGTFPAILQPFGFFDAAWVWNRNTLGGVDRLASAGGGVRAAIASRLRLDATLAVPLQSAGFQTRRGPVRVLISVTSRLGGK